MKKVFSLLICLAVMLTINIKNISASSGEVANEIELNLNSPSVVLMEFSSGTILYSKNPNQKMYPASMTKMMSIYLFLESLSNGSHSFDEVVNVSAYAASMGGSQIFLKENEQMTFEDLFKAVTIASANDATVALAEQTYGSIETFVKEMNARSKEFGMINTNFVNATGFHDPNHYTSANDMAILARKLLKDYKDILLQYTSIYDTYIRQDSASPFWLVNTNRMLKYYQGMDGLKTGYTSDSGFNLTATASRNNMRLISVVMGGETSKKRNQDTSSLLDYGFNNYKVHTLYKKGETITKMDFMSAKTNNDSIIANEDVNVILKKNIKPDELKVNIDINKYEAPKNNTEIIGKLTIKDNQENILATYDLFPLNNIEKLSFFDLLIRYFKMIG